ncbi:hypothetical protein GALMADRAFT_72891 [Galerina marginata CBS 339.88]|uniref:LysM domain-containing protein n=1 Tax=Galerina marginata (strain CBS 339.88) TaxID=685588 RepID=A0A067SQH9_GALM3|nr:hypothetical protein GALMADRAFT_72891 [Galerina marginata CBS 339.88]
MYVGPPLTEGRPKTDFSTSFPAVIAAACTRSYTIQAGDYCDKISQAQNVSTYQIAAVNSDKVNSGCSNLIPGESLCLAQNEAEDCRTTYIVLPGDTCADVAQKNALNTTILYLNNPQIDETCSNIYDGEARIHFLPLRNPGAYSNLYRFFAPLKPFKLLLSPQEASPSPLQMLLRPPSLLLPP